MRMLPTEATHTPLAAQAAPAASAAAATPEHLAQEVAAANSAAATAAQPDMASQQAALQLQTLADAHPAQSQAAPAAAAAQEDAMQGVIEAEPELPQQHGAQGLDAAEPEEPEVQHLNAAGLEPQPTDETLRISAPAALQEPAPAAVSPASAEEILDLSEVSVEKYGELYHGENPQDDAMWISIEQERANAVAVVEDEQAQGEGQQIGEDEQTEGEEQQVAEEDAQTQGEKRQIEDELHSGDVRSEASHQQGRQTKRVKLEGSTDGSEAPRSRQRLLRQLAE
jgi:hypothetical protein